MSSFWCGAFGGEADIAGRLVEQFIERDAARIFRARLERLQHQERHHHGARPIRHLGEMERKPARQQHDLDRHHRHAAPAHDAVEREQDAREDIAMRGAAAREDRLARAPHMRRIWRVPDHLECEIGLHARAHVEVAAVKQRPAAMRALDAAQIDGDLLLQLGIDRLAAIMAQSTYSAGMVASASSS